MMFLAETKKMDMIGINLAASLLHSAEEGSFAVYFLSDYKAMKR